MAATDFLSRVVVNFDNVLKGDNSTYDSRFDFEEIFGKDINKLYLRHVITFWRVESVTEFF